MCPVLPSYNSERNITAKQAAPFRDEAAAPFEDQQKIIGTLQDITQKWSDAQDVMDYTSVKANYEVAVANLQSKASSDSGIMTDKNGNPIFVSNANKYIQELKDINSNSLATINNKQLQQKIRLELEHNSQIAAIKINADFAKKQLEFNKGQSTLALNTLYMKAITTTGAEKEMAKNDIATINNSQIGTGTQNPQEMQVLNDKAKYNAYQSLIALDPQRAIKTINSDDLGLSPEDKNKLIREAQKTEKANQDFAEWQLKQTQTQGTLGLSEALHNKTLTPAMVRTMQQNGVIDSETAAIFDSIALNKKYEIPEVTSLAEPDYFLRLLEDSQGDKPQINKILKDAATAYSESKIGTNQYLYFIQSAKETFDRQSKGIFTKSEKQNAIYNAINGIKAFADNILKSNKKATKKKTESELINKFFDRYKEGDDPVAVQQEITDEEVLRQKPEIATFPKEGKVLTDKNGNKLRFYPTGRREEVK